MSDTLYSRYLAERVSKPLDECSLIYLTGNEAVEALWSLNDRFRSHIHRIATLPYQTAFEKEADKAIEASVFNSDDWDNLSAQAWRVLLERHQQAIIIFMLKANEPVIPVPQELPAQFYQGAILLFGIHQMKLPLPVQKSADLVLFANTVAIPTRLQ